MSAIQAIWQELIDQLQTQKEQVVQEICEYPPPIPACDAQFNYLLEQRDRLSVELSRLNKLSRDKVAAEIAPHELLQFAAASPFVSAELEQTIRLRLEVPQD